MKFLVACGWSFEVCFYDTGKRDVRENNVLTSEFAYSKMVLVEF
jgi:hypothetical protein